MSGKRALFWSESWRHSDVCKAKSSLLQPPCCFCRLNFPGYRRPGKHGTKLMRTLARSLTHHGTRVDCCVICVSACSATSSFPSRYMHVTGAKSKLKVEHFCRKYVKGLRRKTITWDFKTFVLLFVVSRQTLMTRTPKSLWPLPRWSWKRSNILRKVMFTCLGSMRVR